MYTTCEINANNWYNKNKTQFIDLIDNRGIIYEYELGLSSVLIENCFSIFGSLLANEGLYFDLSMYCHLESGGDTLYAIFDLDRFDYEQVAKLIQNKYHESN